MNHPDPRIQKIREHATAWRERFEVLQNQKLAQFATEPLDKKTAITCTAFILEAITGLREDLKTVVQEIYPDNSEFKYIGPDGPDGPLEYSDPPQSEISGILMETINGLPRNDELMNAYCNAFNAKSQKHACQREPLDDKFIERALTEITKVGDPPQ